MKEKRFHHTLGVVDSASRLAKINGVDEYKAMLAAYLHDVTKDLDINKQKEIISSYFGKDKCDKYPAELYHALTAYVYVKEELKIVDEDILNAIMYHPMGRKNMTILEQIIFVADYVEDTRKYEACIKARNVAYNSLIDAVILKLEHLTLHMDNNEATELSKEALDYYKK